MKKIWQFLTKPSGKYSVLALVIVGALIAIAGVVTFHASIEFTSTNEFCTSCHTMKENFNEYKNSIHYKNAAGVRAECRNCHIPENNPIDFMKAKLGGIGDIYAEFVSGTISTPEKFEDNRLRMAQDVWKMMSDTNSAPCKSCHSYTAMDHAKQSPAAAAAMTKAAAKDMNCIECHKGIAHELPNMAGGFRKTFQKMEHESVNAPDSTTLFSLVAKNLYNVDNKDSAIQGQLLPASEVKVLERKNNMLKVEITGWMEKAGRGRVMTQYMGKRVFKATVRNDVKASQKILGEETDASTGAVWQHVSVQAWITQNDMMSSIQPVWDYAKEMYGSTCNACHAAPNPAHFTANGWISGLKAMSAYYRLNKNEERTLLKYLQNHAKDTGGQGQH
ncbi:pentaheme c-type cytochrome TorC [Parasalinivibrio latis]|uniref:pentaheme c-type cytochrome TorC n=1 Tax=Parasalinivibrio latis TaxID=2952610 RepID=UPI0030E424A7